MTRPERLRAIELDRKAWAEYEAKNRKANREYDRLMAEPAQSPNSRPPCGTEAGYMSHYRRKETACRQCKSAHSVYFERKRKEKKK